MLFSLRLGTVLLGGLLVATTAFAQNFVRSTTTFPEGGVFVPTASAAFGNGTFVALGMNGRAAQASSDTISAHTSIDGSTWTERVIALPGVSRNNHGPVRFIGGQFIFTGSTSNNEAYVARSADGVSWTITRPAANLPVGNGFEDIVEGGGTAVGYFATTLSSSSDGGATWTARTAAGVGATSPFASLSYGAGRFVLNSNSKIWSSPDGAAWSEIAIPQSSGKSAFGNSIFVLTGTNYKTSTDGVNFTVRPTPAGFTLTGTNTLRFVGGRFLYHIFFPNAVLGSPDGLTWTRVAGFGADLPQFQPFDFVEGNNKLVAVGFVSGGTILSPTRTAAIAVLDTTNLPPLPSAPQPPAITTQPVATGGILGGTATFTVAASGTGNTYQWRKDGANITGATSATLTLTNLTAASAGNYSVVVTNAQGSATSNNAALTLVSASAAGRLVNLSVRTNAGTGDNTLIVGIGVGGAGTSGNKSVLLRGVGPALTAFGVGGALADPVMTVFSGQTQVSTNDDWAGGFDFASVGAFAFGAGARDAAIYNNALASGSYSIQITGKDGATGIALAEIYDATPSAAVTATTPRLINVSARTQVGTGDNILITGFAVGGSTSARLLIRAVGPGLTAFGVGGALTDPKLEIYSGATKVSENDNWSAGDAAAFTSVGAFNLPANSRDAAIIVNLAPGTYTAQVSGVGATTGVALVEVYQLP